MHCHTKMSDGSTAIDELVLLAKRLGIRTIAVTDHDTFAGAVRAQIFGKRQGIEVLPGAEISAMDGKRGRKVHLLCYLCDNPGRLEGICKKTRERRQAAAVQMMQKVMRMYPITPEMVSRRAQGSTNIYKQHIMHALVDAGYSLTIFGELFQKLFDPKVGLAYASVAYPDVRDLLRQVHEAGGLAVLAHPAVYDSYDLLEELAEQGLDGVEAVHPRNHEGDEERLRQIAERYGLVTTGGTDFHGMYSSGMHPLGTCTVPDEQVEALKKRKQRLNS